MAAKKTSKSSSGQDELLASLRRFVRTRGARYLDDPNVTSVGVGHKITDGRRTDEIALQFTVGEKVRPEAMAALDTREIPASIEVDGVQVPTDVVQRTYRPGFHVVEAQSPARKTRVDPVVPGVSVGHVRVSAGTVGCVVYDRNDGTPYLLSNWHVLHGPDGELGDDVVQPGPHDDNRVARNRIGALVRSHLGVAGDCAVATVEDRALAPEILDLGVVPDELGDPELGDKVVKSGRTTGVTHGVVRRVDVLVKLDYGGPVGVQTVGCFEIGVDPARPPEGGEVSMGGDSGAAWMFTATAGRSGTVLAGLHFAGEGGGDPDEHALACLPASVFEKLEIALRPPAPDEVRVPLGYDPEFLAVRIDPPRLDAAIADDAVRLDGSDVVHYTHFSLAQSATRRFAFWVAWNVDGGSIKRLSRSGIEFVTDPRLPADVQVGNDLYERNRLDRGHLARRADLLWGALPEAQRANEDSFFFTNITPQLDDFNQSSRGGVWGRLEDALFEDVDVEDLKVSVFGGPVFHDDDRLYRGVRIPREFWKAIVFAEQGELKCRAFLLTQNLDRLEALELDEFRVFQVTLGEVEARCRLRFPDVLHKADTFAVPEAVEERRPLDGPGDIRW